jgi:hypothetical protein
MLLRERVILRTGGGRDDSGEPRPYVDVPTRAEFAPVSAEEALALGRNASSVSYRMTFRYPDVLPAAAAVTWRGKQYNLVGPSMQYTVRGRLHHQEAVITRSTG